MVRYDTELKGNFENGRFSKENQVKRTESSDAPAGSDRMEMISTAMLNAKEGDILYFDGREWKAVPPHKIFLEWMSSQYRHLMKI